MYKLCRHIMPNGSKCHAAALTGKPYCYFHDRLHRLAWARNASLKVSAKNSPKHPLELPVLENRCAVNLALSQVINALAAGRLDASTAGKIFYGLQIAAQTTPRFSNMASINPVRSVTSTGDGEELAPEDSACDDEDDCNTCPRRETCKDRDDED